MKRQAHQGLVIAIHGRRGTVLVNGRHLPFLIKGRELRPACGDHVFCEAPAGSDELLVVAIAPRQNLLSRQHTRADRGALIAANLTRIAVVCAARPEPDLFLLDRYLCAAEVIGCPAIIVWNKTDLAAVPAGIAAEYRLLGYPVIAVAARADAGVDALRKALAGQVSILVGQSGVGKSSLVNALTGATRATVGDLSARGLTGTHTTTSVVMYPVAGAGWLVDAPGVRDFVPALPDGMAVSRGFAELERLSAGCRFADCRHLQEPGCAVLEAVGRGEVSQRRYASYRLLLEQIASVERQQGY